MCCALFKVRLCLIAIMSPLRGRWNHLPFAGEETVVQKSLDPIQKWYPHCYFSPGTLLLTENMRN